MVPKEKDKKNKKKKSKRKFIYRYVYVYTQSTYRVCDNAPNESKCKIEKRNPSFFFFFFLEYRHITLTMLVRGIKRGKKKRGTKRPYLYEYGQSDKEKSEERARL